MSGHVDVLAVLAGIIEGYEASLPRLRGKQRDECEDGLADLKETRAAVAELIEAAEETQADAQTLGMDIPRLDAAIKRVREAA